MRYKFALVLCAVGVLTALFSNAASAASGKTAGVFDVSSDGAATYTIPIWTPPGPNGMQPNLALSYHSRASNGPLGVGWSLSGLQSISLCPSTVRQDGTVSSTSDKYCLGSQRLMLKTGASYGADGSTYQIELTDFSLITQHGTGATQYFTLQALDGTISEFGSSSDSRLTANSLTTEWLVHKVSDRSGNNFVVSYSGDSPLTISWTPTSQGASTYAYAAVFGYTNKSGADSVYTAANGVTRCDCNRMASISIEHSVSGNFVVSKYYKLDYETSSTTSLSHLITITECADTAMTICLSPTRATYFSGSPGYASSPVTVSSTSTGAVGTADFNGDGRKDIYYVSGSTLYVVLGSATGLGTQFSTALSLANGYVVTDVAGTGKQDLLVAQNGYWYRYSYSAGTFVGTNTGAPIGASSKFCGVADINGDGLPDLVTGVFPGSTGCGGTQGASIYVNYNTSANQVASFSPTATLVASFSATGCFTNATTCATYVNGLVDIDGNGAAEIGIGRYGVTSGGYPAGQSFSWYAKNGSSFASLASSSPSPSAAVIPVNWNDDNCTDGIVQNGSSFVVQISGCNGAVPSTITQSGTLLAVVDWNGDGRSDVLVRTSTNTIGVYLSTGSGIGSLITTTISLPTTTKPIPADVDGDGAPDLVLVSSAGSKPITYLAHNAVTGPSDGLYTIYDGYGLGMSLGYSTLSDTTVYTLGTGATSPEQDTSDPKGDGTAFYVVKSATIVDGSGGTYTNAYSYAMARKLPYHYNFTVQGHVIKMPVFGGLGFEGFQLKKVTDGRNGHIRKTYYQQTFPYTGMVYEDDLLQSNGTSQISSVSHSQFAYLQSGSNYYPYYTHSNSYSKEVGGSLDNTTISTTDVTADPPDAFGNVATTTQTVTDNDPTSPTSGEIWNTVTARTFSPDSSTANWCLNQPTSETITQTSSEDSVGVKRYESFGVDYGKCRRKQIVVDAGHFDSTKSKYNVTTDYTFDDDSTAGFGNVTFIKVSGASMTPRTTKLVWTDSTRTTGQFPLSVSVSPDQSLWFATTFDYDYGLGLKTKSWDPNALLTQWTYDEFGRTKRVDQPDSSWAAYSFTDCSTCIYSWHKQTVVETGPDENGAAITRNLFYLDQSGRPLVKLTALLDGSYSWNESQYDGGGRLWRQSVPCKSTSLTSSCVSYWQSVGFDSLDRVIEFDRPENEGNSSHILSTYITYTGRTTSVKDPNLITTKQIQDGTGAIRRTVDGNGFYEEFKYDAAGSLITVKDSNGVAQFQGTYDYGSSSFQVSAWNPDQGNVARTFDALGELTDWTDANGLASGKRTHIDYDTLSRPKSRNDGLTSSGVSDSTTTWTWGTNASLKEIYRLGVVAFSDSTPSSYSEAMSYDTQGRQSQRTIAIEGGCGSQANCVYNYGYNAAGDLSTLTYPESTNGIRFKLQYNYQNGSLFKISDSATPTTIYWQLTSQNARGQDVQDTLGNGVIRTQTFDAVTGWVSKLQAGPSGGSSLQNASFAYDYAGNLSQRQNGTQTENFWYSYSNSTLNDHLYRLEHTTLNGAQTQAWTYGPDGNILTRKDGPATATAINYDYSTNQAGCAANSTATASGQPHAVRNVGGAVYCYDSNGNMVSRAGYAVSWTSYNYPSTISAAGESAQFWYGPDRQRWKMFYSNSSGVSENTYYIGDLLDKAVAGGVADYRHYISTPQGVIALYSRATSGAPTVRYVLGDQESSLASVLSGTGATVTATNASFTAFGDRRNSSTWSGAPSSAERTALDGVTRQGYTFQTVLGSMGLNHMNGRVQDARTGRMLSADPQITDAGNTQSFNRYSYAINNPLSLIDPSGFDYALPSTNGCMDLYKDPHYAPSVFVSDPSGSGSTDSSDQLEEVVVNGQPLPFATICAPPVNLATLIPQVPTIKIPSSQTNCLASRYQTFFNNNYDGATQVADQYDVDPTLLLGLAAAESGYGTSPQSRSQNNPFGFTPGGDSTPGLNYSSLQVAWQSWGRTYGPRVQGVGGDVNAFIGNLLIDNRGRSGAVDSRGSYNPLVSGAGDPNWPNNVRGTIAGVQRRLYQWLINGC